LVRVSFRVEGRTEGWLLEASLDVKEDLEQAMQESEEHRKAPLPFWSPAAPG
jgi:hypothetical protein